MRICAGGLLVRGGEVLLARRSSVRLFYPGVWDVVGGHCEDGEAPSEALVREVQEEIGVTPRTFEEIAVCWQSRVKRNTARLAITSSSSQAGATRSLACRVPNTPSYAG